MTTAQDMILKHTRLAEAWRDHDHIRTEYYYGTNPNGKPVSYNDLSNVYKVSPTTIKEIIDTSRKENRK